MKYLVDTNVLLRLSNPAMEEHRLCYRSVDRLNRSGILLYFTIQNAAEFWNVATRPLARNGHGLSISEASVAWNSIHETMTLLPDDERVYKTWRTLLEAHQVCGVQVHDARLAAAMLVHNVPCVLTLNTADLSRYTGIEAVHPAEV